jgi:Protein of unknown function (DUF2637)
VKNFDRFIGKVGWLIVVTAALALSFWSLYIVSENYGLPSPLAAIVSMSFDGAAVVCGDLALRYARTHGDSGLAPRVGLLLFALASSYLNVQHAIIAHDPAPAKVLYGLPPVVAVFVLEQHTRYERRSALKRANRVAKSLPPVGLWTWVFHFPRTLVVLSRVTQNRLDVIEQSEVTREQSVMLDRNVSDAEYRIWARENAFNVGSKGRIPKHIKEAYHANTVNVISIRPRPAIMGRVISDNPGNSADKEPIRPDKDDNVNSAAESTL